MRNDKKQLKQDYKLSKQIMGVFLIRNNLTDKVFLASGMNLAGIINRHKFALNAGGHANKELQNDWNRLGPEKFAFEIVEQMEVPDDNPRRELEFLEEMWLEKLKPFGERGYNERKLTREERLRRIAAKRQDE